MFDQIKCRAGVGPNSPDTITTIIGLITPVLVWAIPNKKVA